MISDTQFIAIHGIRESGFFLRLYETEPYKKVIAEIFVRSVGLEQWNAILPEETNEERVKTNRDKAWHIFGFFTRLAAQAKKEFRTVRRGSLKIWKHDEFDAPTDFLIADLPVFVEHTSGLEVDDAVVNAVYDIQNKIHAVSSICESILADFDTIITEHIDEKASLLAIAVKREFIARYTEFENEFEGMTFDDWRHHTLTGVLYNLINTANHTQALVLPSLRQECLDVIKNDNLSKEEIEQEIELYLNYTREQFKLPKDW